LQSPKNIGYSRNLLRHAAWLCLVCNTICCRYQFTATLTLDFTNILHLWHSQFWIRNNVELIRLVIWRKFFMMTCNRYISIHPHRQASRSVIDWLLLLRTILLEFHRCTYRSDCTNRRPESSYSHKCFENKTLI